MSGTVLSAGSNARCLLACLAMLTSLRLAALAQTAPREPVESRPLEVHALTGATVIVAPGQVLDKATIVMRHGRIEAVGDNVPLPPEARVWDLSGLTVTAGWIDLDVRAALAPDPAERERGGRGWNPMIRTERSTADGFAWSGEIARKLRAGGFTSALVSPDGGIVAGQGAWASLGDGAGDGRRLVLTPRAACFASIEPGEGYPGSLMGALALLRQTLSDAAWYRDAWEHYRRYPQSAERPEVNAGLEALVPVLEGKLALGLRSRSVLELLALRRLAREFQLRPFYLGSGDELEWLDHLRDSALRLVIPIRFPSAPAVKNVEDASEVSLQDLEDWARSPENPARLHHAGIEFALTSRGLDPGGDFRAALARSIERGLPASVALAAVTTVPASMLGAAAVVGTVEVGKHASLAVFDGDPLARETRVREVWIEGTRYPVAEDDVPDLRGTWELQLVRAGRMEIFSLEVEGTAREPKVKLTGRDKPLRKASLEPSRREVRLVFSEEILAGKEFLRLTGALVAVGRIEGRGLLGDEAIDFTMSLKSPAKSEAASAPGSETASNSGEPGAVGRWRGSENEPIEQPLGARGRRSPPAQPEWLLVRGGRVWTGGPSGTLARGDILVRRGKIVEVAPELASPPGAVIVEAAGRHVTPGLIDAHSHTAILGGVNEWQQAITAEVSVRDVVRPDDINIYRGLAGGLTCAHLLHGSSNPIGGQSATIKLRWGEGAEGLLLEGARPTIKFALGENVTRANSSDSGPVRYPRTRMGVEQIIRDAFTAARAYQAEHDGAARTSRTQWRRVPRRDLELEALAQVLSGQRLVHCHSYRQDEILMILRVAEDFGFRLSTLQHVLEGYKVGPELARHGAMASTFSDWWAYKFEVYDAIPYNGALLNQAGVITSFNSDSSELARRLNTEAAKAIKYGGLSPEDALRLVTIHPALQLGIAERVGSLEPGKDADLVIWSGDPLSTYTRCLETWIDGRRYFSVQEDAELDGRDRARRAKLIEAILLEEPGMSPAGSAVGSRRAPITDVDHACLEENP